MSNVVQLSRYSRRGQTQGQSRHITSSTRGNCSEPGPRSPEPSNDWNKVKRPPTVTGLASATNQLTPEQRAERVNRARASLLVWLEARRARLGQTAQDVKESPEAVHERMMAKQRQFMDDYMQTQASVGNV